MNSEMLQSEQSSKAGDAFSELCAIIERLRDPGGCPWDSEQTHASLRPNLLEETYETLEAIDVEDSKSLEEELGDILTQIVFHADIGRRIGNFDAASICQAVPANRRLRRQSAEYPLPSFPKNDQLAYLLMWGLIARSGAL